MQCMHMYLCIVNMLQIARPQIRHYVRKNHPADIILHLCNGPETTSTSFRGVHYDARLKKISRKID